MPDPSIDGTEVMERIRERMADRGDDPFLWETEETPEAVARRLRRQMIDVDVENGVVIGERDCDIVPRDYVIDWRVPIVGRIHAVVRRIINAEIRRYLSSSLEKQSYVNRQMVRLLGDLAAENKRLRREVEELREGRR
jgi:hypothetical protein